MTRLETILILGDIRDNSEFHELVSPERRAIENAINILSNMDDTYFEYLNFEPKNKQEKGNESAEYRCT